MKVVRASSSSPTMDGRKTWALTFSVLLFERQNGWHSRCNTERHTEPEAARPTADATPSTTQNQKQHDHWHQRRPSRMYGCTDRLSRQQEAQQRTHSKFSRKSLEQSLKKRSKIDEKSTKIDEKSMKNRSRAVLCVQGRVRDVSRRVRDGSWTTKNRSKADLGTPRTGQERPRAVQKRARDGPKTLPDRPGAMSECIRSIEHCRTTPQNDFSLFSCRRAEAPMCEKCSSCYSFVHF